MKIIPDDISGPIGFNSSQPSYADIYETKPLIIQPV